jgi:predicted ATPase
MKQITIIFGSRQSGKSTMAETIARSKGGFIHLQSGQGEVENNKKIIKKHKPNTVIIELTKFDDLNVMNYSDCYCDEIYEVCSDIKEMFMFDFISKNATISIITL